MPRIIRDAAMMADERPTRRAVTARMRGRGDGPVPAASTSSTTGWFRSSAGPARRASAAREPLRARHGNTHVAGWYYRPVKTISLKVPDEVDSRLEARARRLGTTKSELSRDALRRLLEDDGGAEVSCLDLVRDLIGTAAGPADLASNRKHLRGYGR